MAVKSTYRSLLGATVMTALLRAGAVQVQSSTGDCGMGAAGAKYYGRHRQDTRQW
jgi:hypothetical protein